MKNWDQTLPALAWICLLTRRDIRVKAALLPLSWLALTLVVFTTHKPWWAAYYVHNCVPLCWCAALAVTALWRDSSWRRNRVAFVALVLYAACALPWMAARLYLQVAKIRNSQPTYTCLALKEIARLKPFTSFIFAEEPIYSFHTGIPLPPKLAVLSLKRLWSGDITNERIAAALQAVKPGVILVGNSSRVLPFQDLLQEEYRLIYEDPDLRLYALKTVIDQAGY